MFITSTVPKGTIEYVLPQLEEHGKEALSTGNGWMVMKSPPPDYTNSLGIEQNMSMAVATGTSPDAGLLSILSEDTNTITYPKSVSGCFRPYIPTKSSRYGSGIVQWSRDNPSRDGYSVKDELIQSEWTRDLRCPKSANQTEHRIDGVYNILWDMLYGARALKVPDNCTAYLQIDASNRRSWGCCCNAAVAYIFGSNCSWIDPRNENGWPNAATKRCDAR